MMALLFAMAAGLNLFMGLHYDSDVSFAVALFVGLASIQQAINDNRSSKP